MNRKRKRQQREALNSPTIIYILADDLGYGDLSLLRPEKFQNSNIDRLQRQGMLVLPNTTPVVTVCAPSDLL